MPRYRIIHWGNGPIQNGYTLANLLAHKADTTIVSIEQGGETFIRFSEQKRKEVEIELLALGIGWTPAPEADT